jgi:predicted nucleic acid-binding protein
MSGFVLDASVTLAWCFDDEASDASRALLRRLEDETGFVPAIWPLEVANVLAGAERRGRIAAPRIAEFVALLSGLDITIAKDTADRGLNDVLALARRHSLSSYDATYLDLAMTTAVPLATRDAQLAAAARRIGVEVLPS